MIDYDRLSANVPTDDDEYLADDGLIHCSKCDGARETIINIFGEQRKVRCICQCMREAQEKERESLKLQAIERHRRTCFNRSKHMSATFETSESSDEMRKAENYVKNFRKFLDNGKGLLLYGNVGTGKSHIAACIANALIDEGYQVLMTNFATMINHLQSSFEGRQEYIDSLRKFHLLIIDDLGIERNTEYMTEHVFNIVDSRYSSGLPMVFTTNLTKEQLVNPTSIERSRIYERILERCHPVEVNGKSRRRRNIRNEYAEMEALLML